MKVSGRHVAARKLIVASIEHVQKRPSVTREPIMILFWLCWGDEEDVE